MTKTERACRSGAHHEHHGVLGKGEDGLERPDHGEVVMAAFGPGAEKTTARGEATVCEAVQVSSGSSRQPSGAGDVVTLAGGGSTVAVASGGALAAAVAKQEKTRTRRRRLRLYGRGEKRG
jgi:hypothetical protein